ncbi:MAG TPA: NADH-quinone oxidoreductase subunit NuoK [Gemmataceae bacterium]|nr:NADH-quinone oxidoreductase subunit NuoK [Gemmataceae bacterium]
MISVSHYLAVGAILFCLGLIGFLSRRNLIVMFLSAELMLQGVAINFVAFSRHHGNLHGQVFTLFVIAVAACEAGIALALFLVLYRRKHSLDVSLWQGLREPGLPITGDPEPLPPEPEEPPLPHLAPAGAIPARGEPTHA